MTLFTDQYPSAEYTAQAEAQGYINAVIDSPTITHMAEVFGGGLPDNYQALDVTDKVTALKSFAYEKLDVRRFAAEKLGKKSVERWEVKEVIQLTPAQSMAVAGFKDEFCMEGDSFARRNSYSVGFVLGAKGDYIEELKERVVQEDGTIEYVKTGETAFREGSVTLRMRKLKAEMDSGVQIPYIVLMGSARSRGKDERLANPSLETEFDAMNEAFEREFADKNPVIVYEDRAASHNKYDAEGWRVRQYGLTDGTNVFSISAPRKNGWPRANTPDTYQFVDALIDHDLLDGNEALVVTTDLYVPFQHTDALRLLGIKRGFNVESVGYGGVERDMVEYAAEVKSTIDKVAALQITLNTVKA